jgi:uncharacterized RDD family membrane protein YckC
MARTLSSWLSGPDPADSAPESTYAGERLGFPESGPGSMARSGRRAGALLLDWLIANGLAGLAVSLGLPSSTWATAVLVIWFLLGAASVRLFGFTPGQIALGLMVVSIDNRVHVGFGRALGRGLLLMLVIPALYMDSDRRGLQDLFTYTAVVRR